MASGLKFFHSDEIDAATTETAHTYLFGNLSKPQEQLECKPMQFEVAVSSHVNFTPHAAHLHTFNQEFNYVLEGCAKFVDLESGVEHVFEAGSLFMFEPGTPYAEKCQAGTRILFWKSPGGNDKQLVEETPQIKRWLESWDAPWE